MGIYIQTAHGGRYQPLNPDPDSITLQDVAHSLSQICRYIGHSKFFYSVAQHCVLMARALRNEGHEAMIIRTALMHDAHEAYVGDVPGPHKAAIRASGGGYDEIEALAWRAVAKRFRLPLALPDKIRDADLRMLVTEANQIMLGGMRGGGWPIATPFEGLRISSWIPERARLEFLAEARRTDVY